MRGAVDVMDVALVERPFGLGKHPFLLKDAVRLIDARWHGVPDLDVLEPVVAADFTENLSVHVSSVPNYQNYQWIYYFVPGW